MSIQTTLALAICPMGVWIMPVAKAFASAHNQLPTSCYRNKLPEVHPDM